MSAIILITGLRRKTASVIPIDSEIEVKSEGLLGEKYVSIKPGLNINEYIGQGETVEGKREYDFSEITPGIVPLTQDLGAFARRLKATLNEAQKNLLKNYINNVSNTNSMRDFVDVEAEKLETELKVNLPKVTDQITKIKLTEAINQINNLTRGKLVNEKQVLTLMRYYELVKELKNVHKS